MEYSVEDISPVKKKVTITTGPEEVGAAIMGAVALFRNSVQIDGFRKGKAPSGIIEKRFHDRLYAEARQDLINVHINEVMQKLSATPLAGIAVDGAAELERGKGYTYSIEFETLPAFDLPPYEGMEVEQEKALVDDREVAEVIERIRRDFARLEPVDSNGPPTDGQIANVNFSAYENGEPVEGIATENFDLALGEHRALEDFEQLVKTIPAGQEGEGDIHFPDDFLNKDLAGKTLTMKVRVNAIKTLKLPELDDALAKSVGKESIEQLRESITKSYSQTRTLLNKGAAQKELLDRLLKMVDFPIPDSLLEIEMRALLGDLTARMERQGKNIDSLGKTEEELRKEMLPRAVELARSQVFLQSVARKEGLEVSDGELLSQIYRDSQREGEDFNKRREAFERSGMIFILRDRLLADKAMDLIYAKAKVTEVEPRDVVPQDDNPVGVESGDAQ